MKSGFLQYLRLFLINTKKIHRVLPITFVLYCEHTEALNQLYNSVSTYGPFFAHIIIVVNLEKTLVSQKMFPDELASRITVLGMPDRIAAGSALKKIFPYLKEQKVFLVDARALLKKEVIVFLRLCEEHLASFEHCVVSFQTENRAHSLHKNDRIGRIWHSHFHLLQTACWGGLFFYAPFLLEIGAFHSQLREESLMIDLSWKIQNSIGILVQTIQPIVILQDKYHITREEQMILAQEYPDLYPSWGMLWYRFFKKFFPSSRSGADISADKETH